MSARLDPSKPAAGRRILVVDDSPSARKIMQELILRLGGTLPDLRLASSVAEAVPLFTQWRPDIVFVDVELKSTAPANPGPSGHLPPPEPTPAGGPTNGAELALHFLSRNPGLKVVVCSASDPSDPRVSELVRKGDVEFVVKPVLAARVQDVLARIAAAAPGAPRRR